jgi:hypothetical protein
MPAIYKAAEAILALLQLAPVIVLSVALFRTKRWFIPAFHQAPLREERIAGSMPLQVRTALAGTFGDGADKTASERAKRS